MKKGFLIGAGLIAAGLLLELGIGPIDWSLFTWPVNIVVLSVLVAAIIIMHLLRRRVHVFLFLGTYAAAVPALVYAAALTIVMGLTRQQAGGTWLNDMLTFWPFVLAYTYIVVILGLVILRRMIHGQLSIVRFKRDVPFLLNHLGLFIALTAGTLGNADMQRLQMWVSNNPEMANMFSGQEMFHQYERFAMDEAGRQVELPLAVELKQFIMDTYDDGSPRRFASEVFIYSKASLRQYAATIDVNKPVEIDGWKIYQKDYRLTDAGDACQVSVLELVSDPWLPWVYGGIYMMIAGAVLLGFTREGRRTKQ